MGYTQNKVPAAPHLPTSPAPLPRGLGTLCVGGGAGLTRRQACSAEPCRRRSLSEVTWSMVFRRGLLLPSRQTSVASTAASPVPQGALTGLDPILHHGSYRGDRLF